MSFKIHNLCLIGLNDGLFCELPFYNHNYDMDNKSENSIYNNSDMT